MHPFLTRLTASFAIFCGTLFILGFLMPDKIQISPRDDKATGFGVVVTLPNVTARYRWVQVSACAAEISEDADVECVGFWDRKSMQETRIDQRQYPFPWGKYVPKGPMKIEAVAYDADFQVLAKGRSTVFR